MKTLHRLPVVDSYFDHHGHRCLQIIPELSKQNSIHRNELK